MVRNTHRSSDSTACETTETRIHNPNKPISAYDSDLYNCKMMAMQTNPEPAPSNATNTRCHAVGNTLNCDQRPTDNQPIGAPFYEMQRKGRINSMTEECLARQGWVKQTVTASPNTMADNRKRKSASCGDSLQCSGRLICDNGQCVPMQHQGDVCDASEDCVSGLKCFRPGRSSGICGY